MSLYNLSKIIYVFWTKQSEKQKDNIYEAIVDDFACVFIQCIRYNTFPLGRAFDIVPINEELRLRTANRNGNMSSIFKAMKKFLGLIKWLSSERPTICW